MEVEHVVGDDPLGTDWPEVDPDAPPYRELVRVPSGDAVCNGRLYIPQGPGPHPCVVLLHGFPGVTDLGYLAQILQRAGVVVLQLHYRGAWGSPGRFGWANAEEDVAAAVAFLRHGEGDEHGVDPDRVVLVGHSMGGWLALRGAARDPDVTGAAAIAPADFGVLARGLATEAGRAALAAALEEGLSDLGPIQGGGAGTLLAELEGDPDEWTLPPVAPALAGRPVLVVACSRDDVVPPEEHVDPFDAALRGADGARYTRLDLDTTHDLTTRRMTLARLLLRWLHDGIGWAILRTG